MERKLKLYKIKIPLIHNSSEVFQELPEVSCDYVLSSSVNGSFVNTYNNETVEIKYSISQENDQTFVALYDVIAMDRYSATKFVKDLIKQICIELTYLFVNDETNLHSLQPRIEADWNNACFEGNEYVLDDNSLEPGSLPGLGYLSMIPIEDSVSISLKTIIDLDSYDLNKQKIEDYSIIIQEFYLSLGIENVKSKFFHLYSIIEFCSEKYKEHSNAKSLLTENEKCAVLDFISSEFEDGENKSKRLKESNAFNNLTDLGRSTCIVNILNWMGINSFDYKGECVLINKKLLSELNEQRNQLIHVRKGVVLNHSLEDYVGWLLSIDLKILKFVRNNITYCLTNYD